MQLHLTLAVEDLANSLWFYRELLQLQADYYVPTQTREPFVLVCCGATRIVLQPVAYQAARHPAWQSLTRGHQRGAGVQLEFSGIDMADVTRRLAKEQWPLLYELEDHQHKRREIWIQDPDGYVLILNDDHCES